MCAQTCDFEIAIIGGGIVGVATARALSTRTDASLVVLEAEDHVAAHQTGHNSGVIHSGIYYTPGSLKARLCQQGRESLYAFCRDHGIKHERCGKVIVATDEPEAARLEMLHDRGRENGLSDVKRLAADELVEFEPYVRGVGGLWVGDTGIVDFAEVTEAICRDLKSAGREVRTSARVLRVDNDGDDQRLVTTSGIVTARYIVNCAGLESDRVARLCGVDPKLRIVPFRGEYYEVTPNAVHLVRNLIYPVPDPRFPFLGVHFTRRISGKVEVGPNAVLALSRNGYTRWRISLRDVADALSYRGFRRLIRKQWRMGIGEMYRSISKKVLVRALQRLVPFIGPADLVRGGSGVRAQAVEPDGSLVDDFRIIATDRAVHVLNAPSPAATAALAIGAYIADEACRSLQIKQVIRSRVAQSGVSSDLQFR